MKLTMKLLAPFFGMLLLASVANAESPREQLNQMVEQLQKSPNDNAQREQIIKLVQKMMPAPDLPEEAERRMARGIAAFKAAQSVADYQDAVKEFTQATLAAPWFGDAYYNLGVAQDKAEQYDDALRNLKLALMASPGSKDIKDLMYQVEYRADQANSPEGLIAKRVMPIQQKFAVMIQKLDGATFLMEYTDSNGDHHSEIRFYKSGHYNMFMCTRRESLTFRGGILLSDRDRVTTIEVNKPFETYVQPMDVRGQEFFQGCLDYLSSGRPSADGRTIDEIPYAGKAEGVVIHVWHRK